LLTSNPNERKAQVRRILLMLTTLLALALVVAACGSSKKKTTSTAAPAPPPPPATSKTPAVAGQPGKGKPAIVMGDKNFTEQFLLGELYKQALEARGYTVKLKKNIGSSELIDKSLTSGKIDMYPEYTGVIVQELKHQKKLATSADQTYNQAQAFEQSRGFLLLEKTPFEDKDALAAKAAYAKKYGLKSVPDLKKAGRVKLGADAVFRTRQAGLPGLKQVYGLSNFAFTPLQIGLQYQALKQGKIDVADVFTTDGQLQGSGLVVLTDPKGVFGFQNVAPVVSKKLIAREGGLSFAAVLNSVSEKLTTPAMQKMNAAVDINKQDPAKVAKLFLGANGLLK
jgi:osmoprotectant transport system substrate-binding protein